MQTPSMRAEGLQYLWAAMPSTMSFLRDLWGAADFGGAKIHIIVSNAGYTWDDAIHKITDKQWGLKFDGKSYSQEKLTAM